MITIIITAIFSASFGFVIASLIAVRSIIWRDNRIALLEQLYIAACEPNPMRDATVAQWVENNKSLNEQINVN